jgi:hypothetical protein
MPFMVIYSTSDGTSCHEQADAIDEAALFVERLRNKEGIEEIRIYRMEEISFAFRPYYKVELGMPERQTATPRSDVLGTVPPAPATDEPAVERDPEARVEAKVEGKVEGKVTPAVTEAPVEPTATLDVEGDPMGANGRRGLFGR